MDIYNYKYNYEYISLRPKMDIWSPFRFIEVHQRPQGDI